MARTSTLPLAVLLLLSCGDSTEAEPTASSGHASERRPGRVLNVAGRGGGRIHDDHTTTSRAEVAVDCTVAALSVSLHGQHAYPADLEVALRSPAGQVRTLQRATSRDPFRRYDVPGFEGARARGHWVLTVRDQAAGDSGQLAGFYLRVDCEEQEDGKP